MAIVTKGVDDHGPLVEVTLEPDEALTRERQTARLPAVTPYLCTALIDTGARRSLIDLKAVESLGLESIGVIDLITPTTGGYVVDCLNLARLVIEAGSYENVVKKTILLGEDTCATICVAGWIAGIRYGVEAIPERWRIGL